MSGLIAEIVQRVANGKDIAAVRADIALLQPHRHEAIRYLLPIFAGQRRVAVNPDIDGRDAHANLMEALFALGREDVEHVIGLLEAELAYRRMQPAFALTAVLGQMDHPAALEVLAAAVRHPDFYVRCEACIGLGRLRLPEALPFLNRAAADRASDVRLEAVRALIEQGDASSLPILHKRLQDRFPGIRAFAQEAITATERRLAAPS